jgi:DNA polymerase-4
VDADRELKSVGHEETYAHDKDDRDELHGEIVRMADSVASRLRAGGLAARTVTLKVRFGDFVTITRSQTVPSAVDTGPAITRVGSSLLAQVDVAPGVRLLGISVSNLSRGAARQLSLDLDAVPATDRPATADDPAGGAGPSELAWEDASRAIDNVRRKFGDRSLGPAVLLEGGRLRVKRGGTQWGPPDGQPGEPGGSND